MTHPLTLNDLKAGQKAIIAEIPDVTVATQAMRMGIAVGEAVACIAKVPAGPTVILHGGMELAIGQDLSKQIKVQPQ